MKQAAIGALLLLFLFAGSASASTVVTGCQSITLTNSPLSATVYVHGTTTVVLGPVAGNAGPYAIPAGTYDVVWSDGYTKSSVVVGPCESITQPTPTPTPEVQLCDGPCATAPADARYPCTSNIAVIGPPCPDPTPSVSPSSSPTPQATPSVPPSATPRTPDVTPRITLPPTSTTSTDASRLDSTAIVGLFFGLLGISGIAIVAAPRRKRS